MSLDKKISELTNGDPALSGDLFPVDRSGADFAVTAGSIAALAGGVIAGATMFGPGFFTVPPISSSGGIAFDNRVRIFKFTLLRSITLSRCSIHVDGSAGTGHNASFGVYSVTGSGTGSKLVDSGLFTSTGLSGGFDMSNTFTPVTLLAGTYYHAITQDNSSGGFAMGSINIGGEFASVNAGNIAVFGWAVNPSVGGALPATLGGMNLENGDGTIAIPIWE